MAAGLLANGLIKHHTSLPIGNWQKRFSLDGVLLRNNFSHCCGTAQGDVGEDVDADVYYYICRWPSNFGDKPLLLSPLCWTDYSEPVVWLCWSFIMSRF